MAGLYSVDLSTGGLADPSESFKFVLRSVTSLTIAWDKVHESQQHKATKSVSVLNGKRRLEARPLGVQ